MVYNCDIMRMTSCEFSTLMQNEIRLLCIEVKNQCQTVLLKSSLCIQIFGINFIISILFHIQNTILFCGEINIKD